jgi:PhzF family phenazine biosynthesis protein
MRRRFVTLDVFTERRFAGNPLAVVLDSDGLGTDVMQAIALEAGACFARTAAECPCQSGRAALYCRG